jgi:hypothetical protein
LSLVAVAAAAQMDVVLMPAQVAVAALLLLVVSQ